MTLSLLWNWKTALFSAVFRSLIFLFANLSSGFASARNAAIAEVVFRFVTSGFYGAAAQQATKINSVWLGVFIASIALPLIIHLLEFLLHAALNTPNLTSSISASAIATIASTLFNYVLMRIGLFITGERANPLTQDLRQLFLLPARALQRLTGAEESV